MRRLRKRAFTLIELLTVMAISAILLGLIMLPLFQSFGLTRMADAFSNAQDRARVLTQQIAREVGNASLVRGSEGAVLTTLNGNEATLNPSTLIIRVPAASASGSWPGNGATSVEVALPFSKLDLWMPAQGDPERGPSGAYVDPITGKEDPTLVAPKGQVNLPAAPGAEMVRYFLVLRDPFQRYNNPYDNLLMSRNGSQDNLYTLVRAKVVPYVYRLNRNGDAGSEAYRPNLDFFDSDDATDSKIVDFDDPRFMLPNLDADGNAITTDAKAARIRNWLNKATRLTDVSRLDMIMPIYDKSSRLVKAQENAPAVPLIVPLIQFRPAQVSNEPAKPMQAVRPGEETDSTSNYGSDVYMTKYGLWGGTVVRVFPRGYSPFDSTRDEYLVAHRSLTNVDKPLSIYAYDPDSGNGIDTENAPNTELFDIATYDNLSRVKGRYATTPIYPFTQAVLAANANSNWLARSANDWRQIFTPFKVNRDRGRVVTSFGIDEVGNASAVPSVANNLPVKLTGDPLTPDTDASLGGNFYDASYSSINRLYNKIYSDYPSLRADNVHRFIDLRVVPNSDGTPSPLYPGRIGGQVTGFGRLMPDGSFRNRVTIVPGSDVVFGPDQLPGPNYGREIRYTRVATGRPGPNQYRINYTDMAEPTAGNTVNAAAYRTLYPELPAAVFTGFDPTTYDPQNLVSAVLQPRFKVGYVQLYSGPDVPIPTGAMRVYYKFQFTGTWTGSELERDSFGGTRTVEIVPTDQIAVDYDTRQLMDVLLTIRSYAQANAPEPQTVTLKSTATVRNFTR